MRTHHVLRLPLAATGCALLVAAVPVSAVELIQLTHTNLPTLAAARDPSWSPDGQLVAYTRVFLDTNFNLFQETIDVVDVSGQLVPWPVPRSFVCREPTWSPDGRRVAVLFQPRVSGSLLHVFEAGRAPLQVSTLTAPHMQPAWSPDGRTLAIEYAGSIWVVPAAGGGQPAGVTRDGGDDAAPTWSPDGTQIAFCSSRSGNLDVWIVELASGAVRRLTTHPGRDRDPSWSADGRWIAFSSTRAGGPFIWVVGANGGTPVQVTSGSDGWDEDTQPAWSPDGTKIAFRRIQGAIKGGSQNVWLAANLPDFRTPVRATTWTQLKSRFE